ncbi:hypothetical protein LEP1GSC038_2812 [Leptospira weilii str. 2006001855]|uniref:Uncharacterized protein n=1 Tax=Leptospira weilii str. 2006001855 TaxID=996804 RepID=M6FMG6_9LEPT|nr:hypothetical protein LEP1GSC051_1817 [Leptospira sp. P2653]EMM73645.1 hypothetical protein LEP1GSC038_2812 [Leptospira weilii str. 2006001855]
MVLQKTGHKMGEIRLEFGWLDWVFLSIYNFLLVETMCSRFGIRHGNVKMIPDPEW